MNIDLQAVEIILASGIGGLGVRALTAILKEKFNAKGFLALLLSIAVCAVSTAAYLFMFSTFQWLAFAVLTAFVFMAANGYYQIKNFKKKAWK